ncbi:MAG: cupredoxin domain-containing protein [Chloroflexota bacterium]|mgnify:CR=1 FL=1
MRMLVAVLGVTLVLGACQSSGSAGGGGDGTIAVSLKEWAIEPKEIRATGGAVTIRVKNVGNLEHDFVIVGAGKIDSLLASETKTLQVQLAPGTYKVLCDLPGHSEAGMTGTLVVR